MFGAVLFKIIILCRATRKLCSMIASREDCVRASHKSAQQKCFGAKLHAWLKRR